jgi:hypothetical protein
MSEQASPEVASMPPHIFVYPFRLEYMLALSTVEHNFVQGSGKESPDNTEILHNLTDEIMHFLGAKIRERGYAPVFVAASSAVAALSWKIADGIRERSTAKATRGDEPERSVQVE